MALIERLKQLEARIYAADAHEAPKYVDQFRDELHEAWPKLLAHISRLEAVVKAAELDLQDGMPNVMRALAALDET